MPGPASAYAALELEPGADRAAIEEAYRRLIKRYHPDRSGGDADRAAEINRAYFELRQLPERMDHPKGGGRPSEFAGRGSGRTRTRIGKRRRSSRLWPVLTAAIALLLLVGGDRMAQMGSWIGNFGAPALAGRTSAIRSDSVALDGPLGRAAIATAMREAEALARRGDKAGLAQHSRACHRQMRAEPELAQLDRCAAFDNAVAALIDPDPINDRGPFGASAVTSRQMTAAGLLSSDYLAIERRLDRIRTTVELGLRPPPPPPMPKPIVETDEMVTEPASTGTAQHSD
jgi:hypothetical protein